MDTNELFESMRQQMDARRVFGEPVERDGVTVIPVAAVMTGAGGGFGDGRVAMRAAELGAEERPGGAEGAGGGYGLLARPVGAWVIRDGNVEWRPAVDFNWVIAGGQLMVTIALVAAFRAFRRRRRR